MAKSKRNRAIDAARKMLPPIPSSAKDLANYNPASLKDQDEAALTNQYKLMRDTIRKRKERMLAAGYDWQFSQKEFPPISKVTSSRELRYLLSDAARVLASDQSSVTGMHKIEDRTLHTLQNAGYNLKTRAQVRDFGKFMEAMREKYSKTLMGLPSDQVAAAWQPEDTLSADGFSAADTVDRLVAESLFED